MSDETEFSDAEHALVVGYIVGILLRDGLSVSLARDDKGNYRSTFTVTVQGVVYTVTVLKA